MTNIHRFEIAGLGKAPFRFIGIVSLPSPTLAEQNPSAYNAALCAIPPGIGCGTCAFCGMALVHNAIVQDVCGKRFVVGTDCVSKVGDAGLVNAVRHAQNAAKRAAKQAAAEAAREADLAAQRRANGGRTNWEVQQDAAKAEQDALRAKFSAANAWLIAFLNPTDTGFCGSVARYLQTRPISSLSPRCLSIVQDIWSKAAGRSGSKAYNAASDDFDARVKALDGHV